VEETSLNKLIHTGTGEFIYNVTLFGFLHFIANVGVLKGIPKIIHPV
jgi:hypothetical protein